MHVNIDACVYMCMFVHVCVHMCVHVRVHVCPRAYACLYTLLSIPKIIDRLNNILISFFVRLLYVLSVSIEYKKSIER